MRVLISGGGTGGHVYPALAVVPQLQTAIAERRAAQAEQASQNRQPSTNPLPPERPQAGAAAGAVAAGAVPAVEPVGVIDGESSSEAETVDLLWVGSANGMERALVEREGIAFRSIDSGQIKGKNPLKVFSSLLKMVVGIGQSKRILDESKPDVCFVTGGYVCAPMVLACWQRRVPILIYLPDMSPGWAIRWMSKLAQRVAVSFPAAAKYFGGEAPKGKGVVTGYPVRQEVIEAAQDRSRSRRKLAESLQLSLKDDLPLLLVWGGSSGARSINRATWALLSDLLPKAHVLHVIGNRDWELFEQQGIATHSHYHPVAYLHDAMALALAAADITVSRAGASALGEYPVARLPSILVPLLGVKQEDNAELLAREGAAVMVPDAALNEELKPALLNLLEQPAQRKEMEQNLAQLAKPEAALNIARELTKLSEQ